LDRGPIETSLDWASAKRLLRPVPAFANPIGDLTSPWLVSSHSISRVLEKARGKSPYRARLGIYSSPTSVFWVRIIGSRPKGLLVLENEADSGKNRSGIQFSGAVEPDSVWPLARGRDLERWRCRPSKHVIMAYNAEDGRPTGAATLKRDGPKLYGYLRQFEDILRARKNFQKYFDAQTAPFWAMFNVGPYTFAPYKVAWRYVDSGFRCAVISKTQDANLGEKIVIPDGKLVIVPFESKDEAHYVCGLLNSSPVQLTVKNYAVSTQISTHIMDFIGIPQWSATPNQKKLAKLSADCHNATAKRAIETIADLENEIDQAAAKLWGISDDELSQVQEALAFAVTSPTHESEDIEPE
jgi:hypothetical protein